MRHAVITPRLLLVVTLLIPLLLCTQAFAGQGDANADHGGTSPGALSGPQRQKIQNTREKLQDLHHKLTDISTAALKNNPDLQTEEAQLRKLVLSTMKNAGYEPKKEFAHIQELASQLNSKETDAHKREQLIADYRQTRARLIAAQREALANGKVQQAQQVYHEHMRQAMLKENSDTDTLIRQYNKTRMELRRQIEQAMTQHNPDESD